MNSDLPPSCSEIRPEVAAGLPGAKPEAHSNLVEAGIDPNRLSILHLGRPPNLLKYDTPHWARRMVVGYLLWLTMFLLDLFGVTLPVYVDAISSLLVGLIVIQVACQVLVSTTERFAVRIGWTHYVTGTVAEILSTLPELVVIAFLVPVSPLTAFVVVMVTIYNNALVFSIYSYFLPHNKQGKFIMPKPITDAGTQILIAGGVLGLIIGLTMLTFSVNGHPKQAFNAADLFIVSILLLAIFIMYIYKLVCDLGQEEEHVQSTLELTDIEVGQRQQLVYQHVKKSGLPFIFLMLSLGILGAFLGGERVAKFAAITIDQLELSGIVAAIILAVFAGMSEYVILWTSHRKGEYGIALANAFGGIAQLLFLIVPCTFYLLHDCTLSDIWKSTTS